MFRRPTRLTVNGAIHSKDISIIQREGQWRIAPIYDVPSTLPFGDDSLALPIPGRDRDLSRKALLEFAREIDLPGPAAVRTYGGPGSRRQSPTTDSAASRMAFASALLLRTITVVGYARHNSANM